MSVPVRQPPGGPATVAAAGVAPAWAAALGAGYRPVRRVCGETVLLRDDASRPAR